MQPLPPGRYAVCSRRNCRMPDRSTRTPPPRLVRCEHAPESRHDTVVAEGRYTPNTYTFLKQKAVTHLLKLAPAACSCATRSATGRFQPQLAHETKMWSSRSPTRSTIAQTARHPSVDITGWIIWASKRPNRLLPFRLPKQNKGSVFLL